MKFNGEKVRPRKNRWNGQRILDELNVEKLDIFKVIEPEGFNEIEAKGEWEEIEMAVDSGATETVLGEGDLESIELKEGAASRRGTEYD